MNLQLVYRCILRLSRNETMFYEKKKNKRTVTGLIFPIWRYMESWWKFDKYLAPVVQTSDSAIDRINHYPADSVIDFRNTYPLYSDLSNVWTTGARSIGLRF